MPTNPDSNLDRLLSAARADAPDTSRFEFAFETRLLARLREERNASVFAWAWKLAPFFAVLAIVAGFWSHSTTATADSLAILVAEASEGSAEVTLVSYLTGAP
ncbi:MAG: hypothetical protein ABMA13_12255 [Chthoniobacteraceae bacterium]